MTWDLRLGRWETALAEVTCDAVITDPPYGARVHQFTQTRNDRIDEQNINRIDYEHWTPRMVWAFVDAWSARTRGWMAALTSHDLVDAWSSAYTELGRYAFAPVPCVIRGMTCRLSGDGPSSWSLYLMVSRPRDTTFARWGTLPGAYIGQPGRGQDRDGGGRGKWRWLMEAIVRDYSRPGDLVCDPMAGWGTTMTACESLGRNSIGAEMDAAAYAEARARLTRPAQIGLAL